MNYGAWGSEMSDMRATPSLTVSILKKKKTKVLQRYNKNTRVIECGGLISNFYGMINL